MKRHLIAVLAVAAIAACSDDKKADPTLSQDLALAGQVQPQTLPTFQDTATSPEPTPQPAETRAPVPTRERQRSVLRDPQPAAATPQPTAPAPMSAAAPAPASAPAAAPAISREIGAGTSIAMTSMARVCTSTNRPGDKIVATVNSPVTGINGAVIPAGASVVLEVVSAENGTGRGDGALTFRVRSVVIGENTYPAYGDVVAVTPLEQAKIADASGGDKKKVIGGAIAGAIAGRILGGSTKATVIGAAAGAATGAAVAKNGERSESCLPQGAAMRVDLRSAIVLS
jgi:hypothetical protein